MPTLVSTQTFSNGSVLSASALTNHVVDATPLATFISGQTAITSPLPDDEFLVATAGSSPAKKVTLSTLASHLPTGTTAIDLAVTGATTLTGALNANGNTILGDAAADTLTVNATSSFGAPVTVSSDTTLGSTAISGSWTRSSNTVTITKTAHGLTTGTSRYFVFTSGSSVLNPPTSNAINGSRPITYINDNQFSITVSSTASSDTLGTVVWFEKTLVLNSTLTGPLQGNIPVNVASVTISADDEFLIRDASDANRLKTIPSFYGIKSYGNIPLHSSTLTTFSGTGTRALNSTTVNIVSVNHRIRTGDVLYIPSVTGSPSFVGGWYSATTVDNDNFTITTAANTAGSWSLNWYGHTFNNVSGNVYSIFGNNGAGSVTSLQVNFTNKPSASTYTLTLTVTTGSSTSSLIIPYCGVNSGAGSTGLNSSFIKTTNGFGVGVLSYAGGAAVSLADSFLNFTAIW